MSSKQSRLVLLGLIGFAGLTFLVICFIGLSTLSSKSQKMVSLKLQSKVLDYQLTSLAQAKKQVQQYEYIKSVAAEIIPNDKDQAQAVLEIFNIASASGIAIQSITFPASTLGSGGAAVSSDASTAKASTLISQAKPVTGINGLYSVQLTVVPASGPNVPAEQQVTYAKMLDFLNRIELNQRTAQITQVTVQPQGSNAGDPASSLTFSLTINIFIKP